MKKKLRIGRLELCQLLKPSEGIVDSDDLMTKHKQSCQISQRQHRPELDVKLIPIFAGSLQDKVSEESKRRRILHRIEGQKVQKHLLFAYLLIDMG